MSEEKTIPAPEQQEQPKEIVALKPWEDGSPRQRLHAALKHIQAHLNAPKDLENKFGGYKYRSCESILKAVKPLLYETDTTLVMRDEPCMMGDRFYIKATAILSNGDDEIITCGFAREDLAKKGMDGAQLTGATSSYARKYALNALFAIDDSKDSDVTNKHKTDKNSLISGALSEILAATSVTQVKSVYNKYLSLDPSLCSKQSKIYKAVIARGEELKAIESK